MIESGDDLIGVPVPSRYEKRFEPFAGFYETVTGAPYPTDPAEQGMIHRVPDAGLLVLAFNSAWEIDHHFRDGASICPQAVSRSLDRIRKSSDLKAGLKMAVWHHPLNSPFDDRIRDHGFMAQLAKAGFSVVLHGHLHKADKGLYSYDVTADGRKIHVIGAGTFGAPVAEQTPGHPLQYNLLRISGRTLTVETRRRSEPNGAWEPDAIWLQGKGKDPLPRYTVELPAAIKRFSKGGGGEDGKSPTTARSSNPSTSGSLSRASGPGSGFPSRWPTSMCPSGP